NFAFTNFNFYPNPVKDNLKISNNSVIDSVEILSLLGQKMIAKNVNALDTELNLSELAGGIYFVKVSSLGLEKVFKIVKE
uniref:T9SS type A sorting domain-containing protein n=1 Tax=Flavobacterium sp. TaxID=239 RepID=UPI00375259D5